MLLPQIRRITLYQPAVPLPYEGSIDFSIVNCSVNPGSSVSGSIGIATECNGAITNCRISGYATGMIVDGNQGGAFITGLYCENCSTGLLLGVGPPIGGPGVSDVVSDLILAGSWFKNNSVAISVAGATVACIFAGVRIEGANGQAPGGLNPQYGLICEDVGNNNKLSGGMAAGVTVVGQYDVAGIHFSQQGSISAYEVPLFVGVQSVTWDFAAASPSSPYFPRFVACAGTNQPYIYTVANLPGAFKPKAIPTTSATARTA